LIRRRMALFFPPELRIRVEGISGPLPGVPEPVQLPPHGPPGRAPAEPPGEVLPEQRDGPLGGEPAEGLRGPTEPFPQHLPAPVGHPAGAAGPVVVAKGEWVAVPGVGPDPVINDPPRDPQPTCDVGNGFALPDAQDRQGASIHAGVPGGSELPLQAPALRSLQGQDTHGRPPLLWKVPGVTRM